MNKKDKEKVSDIFFRTIEVGKRVIGDLNKSIRSKEE